MIEPLSVPSFTAGGRLGNGIPTHLSKLPSSSIRNPSQEQEYALGTDYHIMPGDVVCGPRGSKVSQQHYPGNERFRIMVELCRPRYRRATTRSEKTLIVNEVVEAARRWGGHFVLFKDDVWYDIGNQRAREKAGHALRWATKSSHHGGLLSKSNGARARAAASTRSNKLDDGDSSLTDEKSHSSNTGSESDPEELDWNPLHPLDGPTAMAVYSDECSSLGDCPHLKGEFLSL